jgi:hypothetical protein
LVVGGTTSSGPLNDVYELPLSGTFAWSAVTPVGTPPAAVSDPSVIYDPVRDRLLWFGGYWSSTGVKNDVWQLSLAPPMTWSQVATSGTPPEGRWQHVAIYDPVRDRMVVVGGTRATPANVFQDVWALSLGGTPTWTELETVGPPHPTPARPGAAYDPVRDRIVFTGGNATYSNRLSFVLSLKHGAVWSQLTPHGAVPEARANMASIYDPVNQQFIIFAGKLNDLGPWYDDTFALQMANGYALELTSDPPDGGSIEKEDTRSCYSPNEMVTLTATPSSGFQFMRWRGDATGSTNPLTVEMSEHQEIVAEFVPENVSVSPGLARFELGRVFPSPAATAVQIEYSLGFESDIDLSVFDVAGRQVATLETGIRPAGTHRVRWDGATSRGSARVGLYFVRYRTAQGVWQKPVVLVR